MGENGFLPPAPSLMKISPAGLQKHSDLTYVRSHRVTDEQNQQTVRCLQVGNQNTVESSPGSICMISLEASSSGIINIGLLIQSLHNPALSQICDPMPTRPLLTRAHTEVQAYCICVNAHLDSNRKPSTPKSVA